MSSSCVKSVCIKSVVGWQWSCGLWLSKISSVFRPTLLNNYLTWPSTIEHLNQINQVSAGHNQWSLRKVRVAKSLQSFLNHFSNKYIVWRQMQQKILNPVKNRTSCFLWIVVGNHSVSSGLRTVRHVSAHYSWLPAFLYVSALFDIYVLATIFEIRTLRHDSVIYSD